jgi:hypothetical protein
MKRLTEKYKLLVIGIGLGIAYGIVTRIVFGEKATLASITYLFIIPVIIGMIPMAFADKEAIKSYKAIIFVPWLTVTTFFLTMFVVGLEGFLCLLVLGGPFFILGTLGAFIYRLVQINREHNKTKILTIALVPFLLAFIEEYIQSPSEIYNVQTAITIKAAPTTIWNNVVRVRTIQNEEYNAGFFNSVGIPRPVGASVDKQEVGGKRIGHFEGGLTFNETITEYRENHKISFKIRIDSKTVRPIVFDQHVLNGNYFEFVDASYELIDLKNGQFKLILASSYQLTSKINFYGHFWGDIILADFQTRLIDVLKNRCENEQKAA